MSSAFTLMDNFILHMGSSQRLPVGYMLQFELKVFRFWRNHPWIKKLRTDRELTWEPKNKLETHWARNRPVQDLLLEKEKKISSRILWKKHDFIQTFIEYLLHASKWLISIRWKKYTNKNARGGTSLAAQWLRICLPMQGTRVWSLVQEDPTYCGAT